MIGSDLRQERERRGLGLDDLEARTKIRVRYLAALEDGRYEALPGPAYARAFLRDYADELGIDPTAELLELDNPAVDPPPPQPQPPPPPRAGDRAPRAWMAAAVGLTVLVLLVVVVLAVAGLLLGGGSHPHRAGTATTGHGSTHPATGTSTAVVTPPRAPPRRSVRLAATAGPTWLEVREGSAAGRLLYEGTLQPGSSIVLHHRLVWLRTGAPWDLSVRVNGRALPIPVTSPGDLMVTGGRIAIVP